MNAPGLPLHLQLFAAAVLLLFVGWLVYLIRYHRLSLRDSLLWLVSTSGALVATLFPGTLRWFARGLNIEVPSNALFALAFVYVLLNLLALTVSMSGQAARTRRLTQECALLRAELDTLRERLDGAAARE
ncbi:DUF2304 domain-containing protein [Anaeromyxobacter diazotrophicus]|uniref:DUF2304 domain-containing protein n=1 Tax=Anaeromyxobacter diazotrophicus TaxID=2590199 RepID=A0A7I9VIY5_9BACT|nr:DUF2304 domain-containing protein [Anaeromyxobacter diazotrophicus]GEJ56371.1 hypothetical protein AMYX_11120 [Anaeromyxobacter diazotrophicus]